MRPLHLWLALCLLGSLLAGCGAPRELPTATHREEEPSPQAALPTGDTGDAIRSPLCAVPHPPPVTDLEVRQPLPLTEPVTRSPFRDPVFGSCLVRVTDRQADLESGDAPQGLKNEYSRVQAFNADGSRILVRGTGGDNFLYDAASLQPLGRLPVGAEPRWDAEDPGLIYYTDGTRLVAYSLESGQDEVVHDFAADLPGQSTEAVWTRHEGRPSRDSRYWGLMAEDRDWLPTAFIVYDRATDQVTVRDVRGVPGIEEDVDHVTISPLGTHFLASFDRSCDQGEPGTGVGIGEAGASHPCGLMVYGRDLNGGRSLLRTAGHYDTALDAGGREVIVFQNIDTDEIAMLDLETGGIVPLWPIDFSHTPLGFHFSGLAYDRPGWALVSTYSGGYPALYTWMDDQVFALELRAGGRVVRLAHTHSRVDQDQEHDYWAEPQATVNRDFSRVLFTSNWGRSGSEEVEMYLFELPEGWIGGAEDHAGRR